MNDSTKKLLGRAQNHFLFFVVILTVAAGAHAMMTGKRGVQRPAESEFGLGPRASAEGRYQVTLEPAEPLRKRKMQTVQFTLRDSSGAPVDGASITVGGGMPQHGHGLPSRPRVTQNLGEGVYVIEGLRFNMGGWWELELTIDAAPGPDHVTFNLSL